MPSPVTFELSEEVASLKIEKPCLIGYIVEPSFPALPPQISITEGDDFAHFCGTTNDDSDFELEIVTDKKTTEDDSVERDIWPEGHSFHVFFMAKPETRFCFFENFAKLFKEALREWNKSTSLNFVIK